MNTGELAKQILESFGLVAGGIIVMALILFLNPEKCEKWSVIFWRVIHFLFKCGAKKIVAHDIQGRVNEFSKSLANEFANFEPVGIGVQWITEKEDPTAFFKENRLVIRMREHVDQDKNFVYASMVFISKALLTKTKKYLSLTQRESIDLFIGRKLFEKEKPRVADKFFEDYFSLRAEGKIMELLEKYEIIDKVGLFFPVLIQELTFLGEKVFYKPKSEKIISEATSFIHFLQNYAERKVGEEGIPTNFEGAYCRCGIVIIAKSETRARGNLEPFVRYIQTLTEKKLENIYLIGSAAENNKHFIDKISETIRDRFKLERYMSKMYPAKIKMGGERKTVNNYLILHRSSETLRYYDREYQEKFVEPNLT